MFADIVAQDVFRVVMERGDDLKIIRGGQADLLSAINYLSWLVLLLCFLVALQIVAKYIIFGRVIEVLRRVEDLLSLTEKHGRDTDKKAGEMAESAGELRRAVAPLAEAIPVQAAAIEQVAAKVEEVPGKVVQAQKEEAAGGSGVLRAQ